MRASTMVLAWVIVVLAAMLRGGVGKGQKPAGSPLHFGGNVKPSSVAFSDEPRLTDGDAKLYRPSGQVYLWGR